MLPLILLLLVAEARAQIPYRVPAALIESLQPSGIRISIPDSDGLELFAVHANINKPIKQLESGDLSKDILKSENGRWVYQNDRIRLKPGDTVNYWLYVQKNKMGYRRDNISWTYLGNELPSGPQGPQGPGNELPSGSQGPQGPGGSFRPESPFRPPGTAGFEDPFLTTTPETFMTFPTLPTLPTIPPASFRPPLAPLPPPSSSGFGGVGGGSGGGGSGGGATHCEGELHTLNLELLRQILALRREEVDADQRRQQELHELRLRHLEELHQEELKLLRQSGLQRPVWRFRR